MARLTVGELKQFLDAIPDDVEILAYTGSYREPGEMRFISNYRVIVWDFEEGGDSR